MCNGGSVVSITPAAATNGHIGTFSRGGLRSSTLAICRTISCVVMISLPANTNLPSTACGCCAARSKPATQIVDVNALTPVGAATDHEEVAASDTAKQLEQPTIAGAVGLGDADDAGFEVPAEGLHDAFGLDLGVGVDVLWTQRTVFIQQRLACFAVNAYGAAIDEAADVVVATGGQQRTHGVHVDGAKIALGHLGLVLSGGQMNHCIAPLQQSIDQREILQHTRFDADAGGAQLLQPLVFDM